MYTLKQGEHSAIEPFRIFSYRPEISVLREIYLSEDNKDKGLHPYCDGHNLADKGVQILFDLVLSEEEQEKFIKEENTILQDLQLIKKDEYLNKEQLSGLYLKLRQEEE